MLAGWFATPVACPAHSRPALLHLMDSIVECLAASVARGGGEAGRHCRPPAVRSCTGRKEGEGLGGWPQLSAIGGPQLYRAQETVGKTPQQTTLQYSTCRIAAGS